MSKAGWIEITKDTPSENFLDLFIERFKSVTQYLGKLRAKNSKKGKNEDLPIVIKNAQETREASVVPSPLIALVMDPTSIAVLDAIDQPKEKDLDKQVAKTSKSGLYGYAMGPYATQWLFLKLVIVCIFFASSTLR